MNGMSRWCLVAALALVASAALAETAPGPDPWIQEGLDSGALMGLVVIEIDGNERLEKHFGRVSSDREGPPGPSDLFEIGSVTKVFTHLLLAELVALDKVEYSTTLGELLPELPFENPEVGAITLLELATHTSGLPRLPANLDMRDPGDPYAAYDATALLEGLRTARPDQTLNKTYSYSNFGVGLLGHLLGRVDGRGYEQALRHHVLAPLGMSQATFEDARSLVPGHSEGRQRPHWHLNAVQGAGGLRASASDLARLLSPWLGGSSVFRHDPSADLERVAEVGGAIGLTRVWHTYGEGASRVYWHNGGTGGFSSFVGFNPETGRGLVLLSNSTHDVTGYALEQMTGSALAAASPADQPVESDGSEYHGHFAITPDFVLSVFDQAGVLMVQATGQPALRIASIGEDAFSILSVDARLVFERDATGQVVRAVLHQNGQIMPAGRVAGPVSIPEFDVVAMSQQELEAYAGRFGLVPGVDIDVRADDQSLLVRLTNQPWLPVFPYGDDRFFYKAVNAQLTFNRKDGRVVSVTLHQNGMDQVARRK